MNGAISCVIQSIPSPELMATGPNQLWSWDITKLRGEVRLTYYYLYVILDVFSRYIVGWMLDIAESEASAQRLIAQTCTKQGIVPAQLTLHADRGAPMIAKSVEQLLHDLQVTKSHSRPYTPDDNPFSEAQFKTMKYRPNYPVRFASYDHAHAWATDFFDWYNHHHYHSALNLMTPAAVHSGQAHLVRERRQQILQPPMRPIPNALSRGRHNCRRYLMRFGSIPRHIMREPTASSIPLLFLWPNQRRLIRCQARRACQGWRGCLRKAKRPLTRPSTWLHWRRRWLRHKIAHNFPNSFVFCVSLLLTHTVQRIIASYKKRG